MGYELKLVRRLDSRLRERRRFDVNIGAMIRLRQVMSELGMLAVDYEQEDVPSEAAYDAYVTRVGHRLEGEFEFLNSPEGAALSEWRPPLRGAGNDTPQPGIAVHKLSSNDMWWVTKVECRESLDAWQEAVDSMRAAGIRAALDNLERLAAGALAEPVYRDDPDAHLMTRLCTAWNEGEAPSSVTEAAKAVDFWFVWLEFLHAAADEGGFDVW